MGTKGYAYTVAELCAVMNFNPPRPHRFRPRGDGNDGLRALLGARGFRMLVAAHRAMLKEVGLPKDTPMGTVNVRPAARP